jgi:hypothetical protein
VAVNEVITMTNITLGTQPLANCGAGDNNGDGAISIDEILTAVNKTLGGCGASSGAM